MNGAFLHVFFPRIKDIAVESTDAAEVLPTGNERILFADDEELLARIWGNH